MWFDFRVFKSDYSSGEIRLDVYQAHWNSEQIAKPLSIDSSEALGDKWNSKWKYMQMLQEYIGGKS
jgi:hypothetical protein